MKILFVENRYKTGLWEVIAKEYEKEGHEIFWIVQNPIFKPSFKNVTVLPFPKKKRLEKIYTPEIQKIINGNRGMNYFGIQSDNFIFWYEKEIEKALDVIMPDLAFGEATLFHELLVINACKRRSILYLNPSTTRYPNNRFSFYLYDTQVPYKGSKDLLSNDMALKTVEAIQARQALPDYMTVLRYKLTGLDWLKDKLRLSLSYYLGERYNTPSPFVKRKINSHYAKNVLRWEEIAVDTTKIKKGFHVLYAMQMQPEANIDVWGYPNNNQTQVIQRILNDLKGSDKLLLKPNPKSKYEISKELLDLVKSNSERIIVLKHSSKMADVWLITDVVVTVTGTIAIECVFDNMPVIMLGEALHTRQKNCYHLKADESMQPIFDQIKKGGFPKMSSEEKVAYLQELMQTSFEGTNGDGLHNSHYLKDARNLTKLKTAYTKVLYGF
ncbi:MAG TPA: hypothetical protein DEQ87_12210 [Algoriphagus sp.]|jgi:hypothetical protein|uniref:hypothetical protein n=3 Tax=Cyclobacteriaceae TaxID=563798 RepID=UPI000C3A9E8E|nr:MULTISPECIES: hypothetical protein [Algoriphagus]MAL13420.1 hypothetical protein [Algoriphagus sp.]HAH38435.1 hypothetical protein [Algoriphagus sp.]HCD88382.1 hypothetical protein [Algoriphagus sp.]|tara:strand:- start:12942 stop:14261 length:1320 start_codon:yes stop_codon:yes gene_type:complete